MTFAALPARDEVQQMHTIGGLALVLTSLTRKLDLKNCKNRQTGALVALAHEGGVKVDF